MKKTLQISNVIAFVLMVMLNYLSNTGLISDKTIGEVSGKYQNLFTPAGYAFSIWGLIYFGLLAFVVYQARGLFKKAGSDEVVSQIGWWFVISCMANGFWIYLWLNDFIGLSVLAMVLLLFSLIKIILNTKMEMEDEPLQRIAFVWWPFSFYSGWITVALVANVSAYLAKINWDRLGLSELAWAIIMVCVAGAINLIITWTRNMREFALVGAWALVAIAVANWNGQDALVYTAIVVAAILLVSSGIHGYKNRATHPFRDYFKSES